MSEQDKRHPPSSYGTKYPYNRVMVTESGHELHWDDTKGKERVRIAHMSGSYTEWGAGGRRVDMTTGHSIQYVKGGLTTTVDKNSDVKVGGSQRTNVDGDSHSEVKGTVSSAIGDGHVQQVGGDSVSSVGGDSVTGIIGKSVRKVGGGEEDKVDGNRSIKTGGSTSMESGGPIEFSVGGITLRISSGGVEVIGGTLTHDGKNVGKDHKHKDVVPGPSLTGEPV